MSEIFPVTLAGREFAASDQTNACPEWVDSLVRAHRADVTFCCCVTSSPVPLVVKRYTGGSEIARYGLARWPGTGLQHAIACRFFSEDDEDSSTSPPAVEDLGDGRVRIHLAESLQRSVQKGKTAAETARSLPPSEQHGEAGARRHDRATLEMLLRKLWRHAGLNIYRGSPRAWYQIAFAVIQAAQRIVINSGSESLADYLFVLSTPGDKAVAAHNERVIRHVSASGSRMYMLGRLKDYNRDKLQVLLPTVDRRANPKVLISTDMLDRAVGQTPFVRNLLDESVDMVVGLATVEPAGGEWWKALSVSALTTSASGIPAGTSAELQFEAQLREHGRTFLKPLPLRDEPRNPSYILLDSAERMRWEIWGASSECVVREMRRRVAEVTAAGSALAAWSANPREPLPSFELHDGHGSGT